MPVHVHYSLCTVPVHVHYSLCSASTCTLQPVYRASSLYASAKNLSHEQHHRTGSGWARTVTSAAVWKDKLQKLISFPLTPPLSTEILRKTEVGHKRIVPGDKPHFNWRGKLNSEKLKTEQSVTNYRHNPPLPDEENWTVSHKRTVLGDNSPLTDEENWTVSHKLTHRTWWQLPFNWAKKTEQSATNGSSQTPFTWRGKLNSQPQTCRHNPRLTDSRVELRGSTSLLNHSNAEDEKRSTNLFT